MGDNTGKVGWIEITVEASVTAGGLAALFQD